MSWLLVAQFNEGQFIAVALHPASGFAVAQVTDAFAAAASEYNFIERCHGVAGTDIPGIDLVVVEILAV